MARYAPAKRINAGSNPVVASMFTLEELYNRWDAAKAAGEDHVKVTKYEMRDVYSWDIDVSGWSLNEGSKRKEELRKTNKTVYEGIPIEIV